MSVILDSLRRARGAAPAPVPEPQGQPVQKPVPEHLRAGATPHAVSAPRRLRPSVVIGVAVVALGTWAAVQLSLGLLAPEPVPTPTPDVTIAGRVPPAGADGRAASAPVAATQDTGQTKDLTPAVPASLEPSTSEPRPQTVREAAPPRPAPAPRAALAQPALPAPIVQTRPPAASGQAAGATPASPPVPGSFDLAVKYHAAGSFDQAIGQYLAVLERDPFNLQARNNLGMLYRDRGARDEAIRQLQLAVKGDPQYLTARQNLAVVYLEAGRLAEARAELNAALRDDPRNADTLVNLALVDMTAGRAELAKETLLKALALDAKHALAHYNLALIYEQGGELARAHHHYSRFLDHAESGYTTELVNVQAKVDALAAKLFPTGRQ